MSLLDDLLKAKTVSLSSYGIARMIEYRVDNGFTEFKTDNMLIYGKKIGLDTIICMITNYRMMTLILVESRMCIMINKRCRSFYCDEEFVKEIQDDINNCSKYIFDKVIRLFNEKKLEQIKGLSFNDYLPRMIKSSRSNI